MPVMACSASSLASLRLGLVRTAWMPFIASVSACRVARSLPGPGGGAVVLLMRLTSFWNGAAPAARGWAGAVRAFGWVLEGGGQSEGVEGGVFHVPGVVGVVLNLGG